MPKNKKINLNKNKKVNLEKKVMAKVTLGQINMRPKCYFMIGSALSIAGLAGLGVGLVFLINIILFLGHRHGPMAQWRFQLMISALPWWIPALAIIGVVGGIWMLKKYDFSYKKNFFLIIMGFMASLILAGFIFDSLGLNEILSNRKMMRRFYQRIESQESSFPNGSEKGRMENKRSNGYNKKTIVN